MKQFLLLLTLLFLPLCLSAQQSETGNWMIYLGDRRINSKFNWHHEVQYRNYNFIGDLEQLLLRTGIGFNLTENNNNILLGYAFIHSENYVSESDEKTATNEHRIYQQFIMRHTQGRFSLQHRYRFEQRFLEEDFKLRLRYFLGMNIALTQKQMSDKTFYLSIYNEIFLNTKQTYFDRNRLYGGFGYRFSKHIRTELGFMNQTTNNSSRNQLNIMALVNF